MTPEPKSADQWFAEHTLVHTGSDRDFIHWMCAPLLFLSVLGLLWSIPVPAALAAGLLGFRWSLPAIVLALIYYARISLPLAIGLLGFVVLCLVAISQVALHAPWPVWQVCVVLFVVGWIGELVGRVLDRRIPSLARDLAFIVIGPAWLMSKLYRKLGLRY
ncbi:MAG TPA: Mpo1-like protein [Opitutus sp.]|nr:Mpo1-like protein [Opitutus sp.]